MSLHIMNIREKKRTDIIPRDLFSLPPSPSLFSFLWPPFSLFHLKFNFFSLLFRSSTSFNPMSFPFPPLFFYVFLHFFLYIFSHTHTQNVGETGEREENHKI